MRTRRVPGLLDAIRRQRNDRIQFLCSKHSDASWDVENPGSEAFRNKRRCDVVSIPAHDVTYVHLGQGLREHAVRTPPRPNKVTATVTYVLDSEHHLHVMETPPKPLDATASQRRDTVEVCGVCGDNTHPTDVCSYEPEYESYPYWGNASPQPDLSYPFSSPVTPRQDEQSLEDMFKEYSSANQRLHQDILQYKENMEQHFKDINSNLQSIETLTSKMNDTLNRMLKEEEFLVLLSCDEQETLKDVTLMSVGANEHAMNEYFAIDGLTPCIYEYWSDHEESEGGT
ncbi:hypothetical protein Sjap_015282 [Stephania japonica]|uniref:Uncharacterized protein n=1 Tax=Stephania japonica TaxID=461633 RepID=A0AAP0NSQ6_9MAGN